MKDRADSIVDIFKRFKDLAIEFKVDDIKELVDSEYKKTQIEEKISNINIAIKSAQGELKSKIDSLFKNNKEKHNELELKINDLIDEYSQMMLSVNLNAPTSYSNIHFVIDRLIKPLQKYLDSQHVLLPYTRTKSDYRMFKLLNTP